MVAVGQHLRVACLQFAPVHGRVEENIAKADKLLDARLADLEELRLLVLPEMAFTGYHWRDRAHIDPVLDDGNGAASAWCKRTAERLRCVVCCGVPMRSRSLRGGQRRHNSLFVAGPDGKHICTYDKHFLYESDKTWAEAGTGFRSLRRLPGVPVSVGLGICMDINPREFQAPSDAFEFARYHRRCGSRLIVFSSAWCTNHPDDPPERFVRKADDEVRAETMKYWIGRLQPLIGKDVHFVCADRVGEEDLALMGRPADGRRNRFCGCSCVISLASKPTPSVMGALDPNEEGVLVVDIPLATDADADDVGRPGGISGIAAALAVAGAASAGRKRLRL